MPMQIPVLSTSCDLERSMHRLQSSEHHCVPVPKKWVFLYIKSLALLTCNIFTMCLWALMNTFLTSWETISGEGMWYSGLPVFIRLWNPWSFTILKGHLFSDTQQTISAPQAYGMRWELSTRVSILPSLWWSMLTMRKCSLFFPDTFILGSNGPITQLCLCHTKHAFSRSCVPSAASTASLPQQFLVCQRSPLVDLASPVSRNWQTSHPFFPQHFLAAHSNTWTRQSFIYSTWGSFLKKT